MGPRFSKPTRRNDASEFQYGGATFALASRSARALWSPQSHWARYTGALLEPNGLRALVLVVSRLPILTVSLTDSPAGRAILDHLSERRRGVRVNCIAQGVLHLPATQAEYLAGRHRQAVRTNTRRARDAGIECRPVVGVEREELLDRWIRIWQPQVAPSVRPAQYMSGVPAHAEWWIAVDPGDIPLGLAVLSVDRDWALLRTMVCKSHAARWLLHTHIVGKLCERGVGHFLVREASALLMSPNLQYFQERLGYGIAHLRPRVAERQPPGSRPNRRRDAPLDVPLSATADHRTPVGVGAGHRHDRDDHVRGGGDRSAAHPEGNPGREVAEVRDHRDHGR